MRREGPSGGVLIPGIGYGRNAKPFLERGMSVAGIEISETAIELARSQLGLDIPIVHGSVTDMPFDHRAYDGIFCHGLVYLLDARGRQKLIRNCYSQLEPGGHMIFTVISKKTPMYGQGPRLGDDWFGRLRGLRRLPCRGLPAGGGSCQHRAEGALEHHLFAQTEDGRREPAKVSEMILEFAEPLLASESGGPRDMSELRTALMLATLCWNAPLYAARGDYTFTRAIESVLASTPAEISGPMRAMMAARRGRFAAVPFAVIADAAGTTVAEARITASAYLPGERAPRRSGPTLPDERAKPSSPGGMMVLDTLFPVLAREEAFTLRAALDGSDEAVEFVAREFYCTEPRCDCRRVILHFVNPRGRSVAASINYAFDPSRTPFDDEPQLSLDPLNPQSEQSDLVLDAFGRMIGAEPDHRERFQRSRANRSSV